VLVVTDIERRAGCTGCGLRTRKAQNVNGVEFYPKCDSYRPARSSVLRSPAKPKCICGHPKRLHTCAVGCTDDWCEKCGAECQTYIPSAGRFVPSRPARKSAPARTKRPRKQRKGKRASIARQCDELCGKLVRARGVCEGDVHGKGGALQWAHGFSRRYRATRWLPINGFCLCAGCHFYYSLRPLEWGEFMGRMLGEQVYENLRRLALKNEKQDMPAVLAKLKAEAALRGIE
jgi:hypothetical protein